ncbi:serine hydrolase domain-containing protein [Streptomyces yaanensis]|uniref:Serine hydrolase domain-containing protein n=1 Tax=Streptomyces yaanensis TaxID=1142239 RepID=A0ABV7S8T7_9ACTN|nr:serine hydrolase domain-containing protein [Streptomyces sp. CGMCC 4.7035]WNC02819.1 serine hydrolase domain-containing protein [Streptomyces sp. CGMCC 4.7035]
MKTPIRTALVAAIALAVAAGPVAVPAMAHTAPTASARTASASSLAGLDIAALQRTIADLPADDATSAVIRVSGRAGSWRGAAGVRDVASGQPVLADGRFRAGSTTKVFTAAVVLQLVAEHRVALNRPVQHYLPGLLPADYPAITVAQLLNHTSGLRAADGPGDSFEDQYAHRFDTTTPLQMVASATAHPLEFTPGEKQHYLNINYTVLGLLIEKVTKDSYEHQVQRRILDPLGMRDTYYPGDDPHIHGPHNLGYQRTPGGLVDVTDWNVSAGWAAGDIISTAADLERFTVALFSGRVVPKAQLHHMLQAPKGITMYDSEDPAAYTMGLTRLVLPDGTVAYGKTGERYGYLTGMGATLDAYGRIDRTLVFSVGSTDAKSASGNPRKVPIFLAAMQNS